MQKYKTGHTPYAEFAFEAYNNMLYEGDYDRAEALRQEAEENNVIVYCENCSGRGEVETDDGYRPCHCVLGQKIEEDYPLNHDDV